MRVNRTKCIESSEAAREADSEQSANTIRSTRGCPVEIAITSLQQRCTSDRSIGTHRLRAKIVQGRQGAVRGITENDPCVARSSLFRSSIEVAVRSLQKRSGE